MEENKLIIEFGTGEDGSGWYAYDANYPDEGYLQFWETQPTPEQLDSFCKENGYVLEK